MKQILQYKKTTKHRSLKTGPIPKYIIDITSGKSKVKSPLLKLISIMSCPVETMNLKLFPNMTIPFLIL